MAVALDNLPLADGTFSAAGALAWDNSPAWSGLTIGQILFPDSATSLTDSANLTYSEASGPRLQVGSGSGTSTGLVSGYSGTSGYAAIWGSNSAAFTEAHAAIRIRHDSRQIMIGGESSMDLLRFIGAGGGQIEWVSSTAGQGLGITAGTATTDVNALSITQTWNAAGVTFTGLKFTITDTASAAGALAMQILGGAAGATNLFKLTKGGDVSLNGYLDHLEMTAPAGVANTARIFAQDNGGKTQLMVIFGSGAAMQLAVEL